MFFSEKQVRNFVGLCYAWDMSPSAHSFDGTEKTVGRRGPSQDGICLQAESQGDLGEAMYIWTSVGLALSQTGASGKFPVFKGLSIRQKDDKSMTV